MKASELIEELQKQIEKIGDAEVGIIDWHWNSYASISKIGNKKSDQRDYGDNIELGNKFITLQ